MSCDLSAVILIGIRDFGRYPLRSHLPRALWTLGNKTLLQRLIDELSWQGIRQAIICVSEEDDLVRSSITAPDGMEVIFLPQEFERGSAGCLFDAARSTNKERLLLCQSNLLVLPELHELSTAHEKAAADVTMVTCPDSPASADSKREDGAAGGLVPFLLCNRSVLEGVPAEGYCDFHEGLLPQLIRAGRNVHSYRLNESVGSFQDWRQYLESIRGVLQKARLSEISRPGLYACHPFRDLGDPVPDRTGVWAGKGVIIHPSVRMIGPVVLSDGVCIAENAIIIGPSVLGPNTKVGNECVVCDSVTWDGVRIGSNSRISGSVLTQQAHVGRDSVVEEQLVLRQSVYEKQPKGLTRMVDKLKEWPGFDRIGNGQDIDAGISGLRPALIGGFLLVASTLIWAYWNPTLVTLWARLTQSDEYSSGLLVPLIALYVAWIRRSELKRVPVVPSVILGLSALVIAQSARFAGLYLGMDSGENLSVVLTVWAVLLMLLGWRMIWKTRAILLFLLLMLPLPGQVQGWITLPLQRWATSSAVFSLEAMGYAVQQQGNIIDINGTQVGVVEACNGLRMVTAFFVIAGFVALIVRRSTWQKIVIFVSSLPIALLCNTIRLTITTIAFTMIQATTWEEAFHAFGGLAMMPLALAMIVAELWILSKIVVSDSNPQPQTIVFRR